MTEITRVNRFAARVRMTEGQLYTAALAVIVALLLTFTGLPNAHRRATGLGGSPAISTNTEVTP